MPDPEIRDKARAIAEALIRQTAGRCGLPAVDQAVADTHPGLAADEHAQLCQAATDAIEDAHVTVSWPGRYQRLIRRLADSLHASGAAGH